MPSIKFNESDVERAIMAANIILEKDVLSLLNNGKVIQACFLIEKIVISLVKCQTEIADSIRRSSIVLFLIEWKYQLKMLSQKMTEMTVVDAIYEVEIIIAACRNNTEPETLFIP